MVDKLFSECRVVDSANLIEHDAVLDDVGHNLHFLVRLSILIVWEKGKCYIK